MKRPLEIRAEASRHIAEAFSWYEARRQGLGWTFRDKLDNAFKLLQEHAEAGPEVYRGLRRVLVDHFPYAVYYSLPKSAIAIRAVLHTRRRPRQLRTPGAREA